MADESIYNWISPEPEVIAKPARYVSQHAAAAAASIRPKRSKAAATMGREVGKDVDPKRFVRAGDGAVNPYVSAAQGVGKKPGAFSRANVTEPKPAVPRAEDRPVHGIRSSKNFVVSNAVENILAPARAVDRREPDYLRKEDYGRTPAYLAEVKKDIEAERDFIEGMLRAHDEEQLGPQPRAMPEDERAELVEALKRKWDEVNHEYQKITFKRISTSNATAGAIRRKEECERQLAELERDIERLSVKGPIMVVDDIGSA